jgi:hypothetical protein
MAQTSFWTDMLVPDFLLLFLLSVFAATQAWLRSGRRGELPSCPKCRYPTKGNSGHHCTECGADFSAVGIHEPDARPLVAPWVKIGLWTLLALPLAVFLSPAIEFFYPEHVDGEMTIQLSGSGYSRLVLSAHVVDFPVRNVPADLIKIHPWKVSKYQSTGPRVGSVWLEMQDGNRGTVSLSEQDGPITAHRIDDWLSNANQGRRLVDQDTVYDLQAIVDTLKTDGTQAQTKKVKWAGVDMAGAVRVQAPEWFEILIDVFWATVYGTGIYVIVVWGRRRKKPTRVRDREADAPVLGVAGRMAVYAASMSMAVLLIVLALISIAKMSAPFQTTWNTFEEMNTYYTQIFVESRGFGHHRISTEFTRKEEYRFTIEGVTYSLRRLQLIGIVKHDTPVVYVSPEHTDINSWVVPVREKLESGTTRPLNESELKALAELKTGANLVSHMHGERAILVGALRADQRNCIECHQVERGTLLGAFEYELDPKMETNFSDFTAIEEQEKK